MRVHAPRFEVIIELYCMFDGTTHAETDGLLESSTRYVTILLGDPPVH